MKIDPFTADTHMNASGTVYYSQENKEGEKIYSFSPDFEDIWTQEDEDAIKSGSTPSKY